MGATIVPLFVHIDGGADLIGQLTVNDEGVITGFIHAHRAERIRNWLSTRGGEFSIQISKAETDG